MKETESVLAMVLVRTGADFESEKESGLAHFLEHMCFKGTTARPSAKQIALEFDQIGAQNNAFTGRAYTGYHARAHKKHAGKILEMVSDIFLNPVFPEEEIQKEKGVVIQEYHMYMDDPQYRVGKLSDRQLYPGQSLGREILGTPETVSSFEKKDLLNYRLKHYSAKNTLVVVAGNFNQKEIEKQIQELFGKMKPGKVLPYPKTQVKQTAAKVAIESRKTDQTHLILSFRAFGYFDKRSSAGRSLSTALGAGMSSRLFQKMREELGICYYVHSGLHTSNNVGTFTISAGVANDRLEEAVEGILAEIKKVRDGGVSLEEVNKVRECRLSSLVLHLETPEDYADFYAADEILKNKVITSVEYSKKIKEVKKADMDRIAKSIFRKEGANLAVVGPFEEATKTRLLKMLNTL
jgi:predicted Zn-dependent peptidase